MGYVIKNSFASQQNGNIAKKLKKLLNLARIMLFQTNMPLKFWVDAILTSCPILNRFSYSVINWKTPFEVYLNKQPDYQSLKTFGYLCFVTNTVHISLNSMIGFLNAYLDI